MTGIPSARTVTCPNCRGPSRYAGDNPYRPFCSERCRSLDLGAWANETFRVEVDPAGVDPDQSPTGDPAAH